MSTKAGEVHVSCNDAIETIAHDWLGETGVDWCNNDGGFGSLELSVDSGSITLDVNQRIVESECAYNGIFDIDADQIVNDDEAEAA